MCIILYFRKRLYFSGVSLLEYSILALAEHRVNTITRDTRPLLHCCLIRSPGSFPTAIPEISACIMPGNSRNTSKWTFTVRAAAYAARGHSRKRASTCSTRTTSSILRSRIPTVKTTSRRSSSLTDSGTCGSIYCFPSLSFSPSLSVFSSHSHSLVSAHNPCRELRYFRTYICEQRM